jgi:adenine-specific DNA-methyltransferase
MSIDSQPRTRDGSEAGNDASGAVYTPRLLADWVASRLLRALPEGPATVLDFACGEGALLAAVARRSRRRLDLVGTDVDERALRAMAEVLPSVRSTPLDALASGLEGPRALLRRLELGSVDGIILNPPWGIGVGAIRPQLRNAGFELAYGQYDSADLFLELAVKLLEKDGAAALILPDSLFFPDRAPVRRFLLERCTLDLVARLGEGFFPGVYRGTAVVVLRRRAATADHEIECVRLSQDDRKLILAGKASLGRIADARAHAITQSRFDREPRASFTIDLREDDLRHVRAVSRTPSSWARTLTSGRGVELSKHGEVVDCNSCGRARPRPRRSGPTTCSCGAVLNLELAQPRRIVRLLGGRPRRGWRELIAGEDVRRYAASPSREIRTGVDGIRYKDDANFERQRLLVRKTGIGLKAALFKGEALTTQTVFHFQQTADSPDFLLAYALGVLCSRVMLAVHLKRTGELEWRSHPYVTQALLAELPIPEPEPQTQTWKQAKAIAAQASSFSPGGNEDLAVERLVAGLYGLKQSDIEWVERVLNEAQGLEGIAALRPPVDETLTPQLVD